MSFIRFTPLRGSTSSVRYLAWNSGNAAVGTENNVRTWMPQATNVSEGTANVSTALTSTQRYDIDFQVALVTTGNVLQLTSATDAGLSVRSTMSAVLPKFVTDASTASPQRHLVSTLEINGAPNQDQRFGFAYNVPSAEDVSWYAVGDSDSNLILAGMDRFIAPEWSGTGAGGGSTATQSVSQVTWPATGNFKYLLARYISAASDFRIDLQVNGANVITLTCPASAAAFASDLTSQAPVTAGQPVSFRYVRTSGAATTVAFILVFGFSGTAA